MTNLLRRLMLGLVLLGVLTGCPQEVQDNTESTVPVFQDVAGNYYETEIAVEIERPEDDHWECRNYVYRSWVFNADEVSQVVACDLCWTRSTTNACDELIHEYTLFKVIDVEVEVEESSDALQIFHGDGQVASFQRVDCAHVYPDDVIIEETPDDTMITPLEDPDLLQLDAVPDDIYHWSIDYFAQFPPVF